MRIAIAGNIGAGKTSLTKQLSKSLKYKSYYEDVIANPYLDDFYNHMERWSFNLQIYFLNSRFKQLISIDNGKENVIQDRTIYEDAFIFAPNLNAMGLMTQRDYDNYLSLFDTMINLVKPPDLLVYLQSSIPNLVNKIHKRGRDYEKTISIEYLSRLNERYEAWITNYNSGKLLKINVDDLDFVENKADYETILELIKKEIF
jgi:deoxyadenosine/deoxycytidine kinase